MTNSDELNSICDGFVESLNSLSPSRNLCNQDGYEIIVSVLGKTASCERIRRLNQQELERIVAEADQLLETSTVTTGEVIASLKAGLQQGSGNSKMAAF